LLLRLSRSGLAGNRVGKGAAAFAAALLVAYSPAAMAQERQGSVNFHARGSFTVAVVPLSPAPADGLHRFSINKELHGDLEATSRGEMFSGGDPKQGLAGYVAIEVVTGTLQGRHGSFALQHMATMDANGPKMTVVVVPGSGTGDLTGIAGTFAIENADGRHSYELAYALPAAK
jgi:hypothetical protein